MGQVLHGSARTTEAVRRAIQLRQESVRALARCYGVSPTTVQKWRKRETTADARMEPKEVRSNVLTPEQEAIIVTFRRHTLLEEKANIDTASDFLRALIEAVPYQIHAVLTDNGVQFCDAPKNRSGPTAMLRVHRFDRLCREHGIEHRLTKPNHPWTNGQSLPPRRRRSSA